MREFSLAEQQVINKIISIPEIQFSQLFSDALLDNARVEIDKAGKIDIFTLKEADAKSVIKELNLVVNLLAYLLNEKLIYAYSNAVIIPQSSAKIGRFQGQGVHTISLPYNRALLARVTIRHIFNLFDAYEPLRSLSKDKFILREDVRHRQIFWASVAAIVVALISSAGALAFQYLDRKDQKDEIIKLRSDFIKLENTVKLLEDKTKELMTVKEAPPKKLEK